MVKTPLSSSNIEIMNGKPYIKGLMISVGSIIGLIASGRSVKEILKSYPVLEEIDIDAAKAYAATRVVQIEMPHRTA
jgi:uncharacterized protein (DUF433 family)